MKMLKLSLTMDLELSQALPSDTPVGDKMSELTEKDIEDWRTDFAKQFVGQADLTGLTIKQMEVIEI